MVPLKGNPIIEPHGTLEGSPVIQAHGRYLARQGTEEQA